MSDIDVLRRFKLAGWLKPKDVGVRREDANRLVSKGLLERRRMLTFEFRLTPKGYILAEANVTESVVAP